MALMLNPGDEGECGAGSGGELLPGSAVASILLGDKIPSYKDSGMLTAWGCDPLLQRARCDALVEQSSDMTSAAL